MTQRVEDAGPARSRPQPAMPESPGRVRLYRLTDRAQFVAAAKHGRKAAQPGLVLQARPHGDKPDTGTPDGSDGIGLGFTASRKVGKAVVRNRARRRLRALAAEVLPHHAHPRYDLVLIARQATATRPYDALRTDLVRALRRLGLYRAASPETDEAGTGTGTGTERERRR